jgi:hypothetical protein
VVLNCMRVSCTCNPRWPPSYQGQSQLTPNKKLPTYKWYDTINRLQMERVLSGSLGSSKCVCMRVWLLCDAVAQTGELMTMMAAVHLTRLLKSQPRTSTMASVMLPPALS